MRDRVPVFVPAACVNARTIYPSCDSVHLRGSVDSKKKKVDKNHEGKLVLVAIIISEHRQIRRKRGDEASNVRLMLRRVYLPKRNVYWCKRHWKSEAHQ